jgi:hypothetical protein
MRAAFGNQTDYAVLYLELVTKNPIYRTTTYLPCKAG